MKLKGILLTTALTAILGVGVFAGVSGNRSEPVEKVEASVSTSTVYLEPSSDWKSAGARFAAYFYGNGDTWVSMTSVGSTGYYKATIPSGYPSIIFCRMNGDTTENNWNNKWTQSADLSLENNGGRVFHVRGWNEGSWNSNYYNESRKTYTITKYAVLDGVKQSTSIGSDSAQEEQWPSTTDASPTYDVPANPAARAGYDFIGWTTDIAGNTPYTKRKISSNLDIYAQYASVSFTVSVAGGTPVQLSLNGASLTEYTARITANAGDILTFKRNGSNYSFNPESASNNNYSEAGVRFGGTFDIYLKTDVNQLWAGGMPTTNGYYLMINGIGHGQMSVNPSNPNEVQLTGAHFNANDKINILNVSGGSTYTYKNPNKNEASVAGFSKDGNDIKCTIAGYYDLYFNHSSNSLYFGESASTACVAFSNAFVAAVGLENGVCDYQGNTNLNDLKAEWVRQYDAWVALGAANQYAQGIMTAKDKTAGDELAACVAMYDYVVGRYGSALNGTSATHGSFNADFMSRNPAPIGRAVVPSITERGSTASTTVATVMASVIAISTAAGFVCLKKKKITK